jgi:hypothetical protein
LDRLDDKPAGVSKMIDMVTEKLMPLQKARDLIPPGRSGKQTAFSTLLRWVLDGVATASGRVRLEAIRLASISTEPN